VKGELDAAETVYEEVRQTVAELGVEPLVAAALWRLGGVAWRRRDYRRAEKLYREALRITLTRGDRGVLPDLQSSLSETLAALGKIEEAERLAVEVKESVRPDDPHRGVTVSATFAVVRAAQGRDEEAEELFVSALDQTRRTGFAILELEVLERFVHFYRERGRDDEAVVYEARLAELVSSAATRIERIA
jgi:tetratricopeptide (TPR) repeat protein